MPEQSKISAFITKLRRQRAFNMHIVYDGGAAKGQFICQE